MRTLNRNKRKVYISRKQDNHLTFDKPVEIRLSYGVVSTNYGIETYGVNYKAELQGIIGNNEISELGFEPKGGDLLYLYVTPSEVDYDIGNGADFVIKNTIKSINHVIINMEKITNAGSN